MPEKKFFRALSTGCDVFLKHRRWQVFKHIKKTIHDLGKSSTIEAKASSDMLINAVINADTFMVTRIIQNDKKAIQMMDVEGKTALHHAVCGGYNALVSIMLKHLEENEKANVLNIKDNSGKTALHYAVNLVNATLVRRLISHGADFDLEDNQKQRPLHCAIINGFPNIVHELLKQKLDINAVNEKNETPLILAVSNESLSSTTIVELCNRGADLNAKDRKGRTALHVACDNNSKETCMVLLRKGADVHCIDNYNKTPFHYATRRFSNETFERFLENAEPTSKLKLLQNAFAKENVNKVDEEFLKRLVNFEVIHFSDSCRTYLQKALETENNLLVNTIVCFAAENTDPEKLDEAEKWIEVLCRYSPFDEESTASVEMYRSATIDMFLKHLTIVSRSQLINNAIEKFDESNCQYLKHLMQFELNFGHQHCHTYLTKALEIKNRVTSETILSVVIGTINTDECPKTEMNQWMNVICHHLSLWKEKHPFYFVMSRLPKEAVEAFLARVDKSFRRKLIKNMFKSIPDGSYTFVSVLVHLEFLNNPSQCSCFLKEALREENELLGEIILIEASDKSKEMKKLMDMVCSHLFSKKERNIMDIWPACVNGQLTIIKSVTLKPNPGKTKAFYMRIPIAYKRHHALSSEAFIVSHSNEEKVNMQEIPASIVRELNLIMKKHAPNLRKNHTKLTIMSISSVRSTNHGQSRTPVPQKACIVLHCRHKGAIPFGEEEFPRSLDGYPVDVREGVFTLNSETSKKKNSAAPPPKAYHKPLRMGCSIGKKGQFSYGTLGGFFKLGNEIGFLTCAHVLADPEIMASFNPNSMQYMENILKQVVCQPADGHAGNNNLIVTECGEVHSMAFTASIQDDEDATTVDAAFVKITKEERKPQVPKFVGVDESSVEKAEFKGGVIPSRILPTKQFPPENGDVEVFKVGASTGFTQGSLCLGDVYILQTCDIKFENDDRNFAFFKQRQILNAQPGQPFFSGGDSGSLIFMVDETDEDAIQCIGLAIGTCDPSNHCICTPIDIVLSKFEGPLEFLT